MSLVKSRKREKCPDFPGMKKKIITSLVVVIYLEKGYVIVGNGLFWLKHKEAQRKINVSMFIGWGGESMCMGETGRRIRKRSRRRREQGVEEREKNIPGQGLHLSNQSCNMWEKMAQNHWLASNFQKFSNYSGKEWPM